jgi:hypothetical protein
MKKKNKVIQNAATRLRVAMKMTVKNIAGRTHGACKNASCFLVSSRLKKRPPRFNKSMSIPIKYGFVFNHMSVELIGSMDPPNVCGCGFGDIDGNGVAEGMDSAEGALIGAGAIIAPALTGFNQSDDLRRTILLWSKIKRTQ